MVLPCRACVVHSFCHNRFKGNDILQHVRVNIRLPAAKLRGQAMLSRLRLFAKFAVFNGAGTFYKG